MRRISAMGVLAATLMLVGTLRAADPKPDETTDKPSAFMRPFARSKPADKKTDAPVEKAPTREVVAKSLEQEQKTYMDRLLFCSRLRQIAAENNDEALLKKADVLEKNATEVYEKRTSTLPAILEGVKAAELDLEQKRNWAPATGSASSSGRSSSTRAPNGKPTISRE